MKDNADIEPVRLGTVEVIKLVSHSDLAIQFAQGKTKGKGNSMFIDEDTIYSYGYHFPIAKRWNKDGVDYLFNSHGYSSSTSCHKSYVFGSLTGVVLEVYDCDVSQVRNQIESNEDTIIDHEDKLTRARADNSISYHKNRIAHLKEQNELLGKYVPQTE